MTAGHRRVVILDGGLATELEANGHDLRDRLWSARVLRDDPEAVEAAHLAYFRAGARVATTASYQATVDGFRAAGLDRETALALIRRSVELAQRARDRYRAETDDTSELLVAGSVGPYGAMLADGSEYRGDYRVGTAALEAFHRPRMEALVEAGADLLAIETIPTVREAAVIVELLGNLDTPAWLSYSCRDGSRTSAGEPIATAVALGDHPNVVAVGVNCTAPRYLPSLLRAARAATSRPLIAYPNGGDRWDAVGRRWVSDDAGRPTAGDVAAGFDAVAVASWTALGASWLGGCCGTRPAAIATLAHALGATPSRA
jgi:homocysteine S-methyltransferase